MEFRNLGGSGLRVSALCLGTMTFARECDENQSRQLLDHWPEYMGRQGTERAWRTLETLHKIAAGRGKTPAQVALAWLLAQPGVSAPILGARSLALLEDNLGCVGWQLSPEDLAELDAASSLPDAYPYHFIRDFAYDR